MYGLNTFTLFSHMLHVYNVRTVHVHVQLLLSFCTIITYLYNNYMYMCMYINFHVYIHVLHEVA